MSTDRPVKRLIFLDSISDAAACVRNGKCASRDSGEELFIALKPSVYAYLRQKGFAVRNTSSYFTNRSHMSVLERSRMAVDWFRVRSELEVAGSDIKDAYRDIFIFLTRSVIHTYLWTIEVIINSVETHRPQ